MKDALTLLKEFCSFNFVERSWEKALALLSEEISWFGTSDHEDVQGIERARAYLRNEAQALPSPYRMKVGQESCVSTGPDTGVALLRMTLENEGVRLALRITAASRLENGVPKLCSMHFSVADANQRKDEYFPVIQGRERTAREKTQLVMSTIPGGLLGGYLKPGFPLYFVNDRLLRYLGYGSQEEFRAELGGLVLNGMHPQDQDRVREEVERQLAEGTQYAVEYRMRKKDGSYIWVHDIGQKSRDEAGEPVVISVCYDITQEHIKQDQLDNLVNALPGGVALYRMAGRDFQVMYQSQGVGRLTGRTPEEYAALVHRSVRDSLYEEDADRVLAAMEQAVNSDQTVSLDYRVPHRAGGTVWLNGSFRRAGEENGAPILHAVFTEMPQLRELFHSIADKSGVAIVVSDSRTHELLYVNEEVRSILHKGDRDYEGKLCHQYLLGSPVPCAFCQKWEGSPEGQQQGGEIYIPQLNRSYMTQARVVNWAGRKAHIEYLTDITEEKQARERLMEMQQNISCGIVVSRVNPRDRSYEIQYMNRGYCQLFEDTEEALRERYKTDQFANLHPEDRQKLFQMGEELAENRTHSQGTLRYRFPGGRIKWLRLEINAVAHSDGTVTTYATFFDVTTQMQQGQQLRDVIHNVPGGVCLYRWDGKKLNPLVISEQFSAMLGTDARARLEQVEGLNYTGIHPEDLPGCQRALREGVKAGGRHDYTFRLLNRESNQWRWVRLQGVAVPQEDGTALCYILYTDVTEERLTAQKLRASEQALDAATGEAGLWYWKYDPANARAYFNEKAVRDFDLPEMLENYPESWLDRGIILPEYRAVYLEGAEKIKAGVPQVVFEVQMKLKDGSTHWAELRFTGLTDEEGKRSIAVCTSHLIDYEKELLAKYEMEKQKPSLGERDLLYHAVFNLDTGATVEYGQVGGNGHLEKRHPTFAAAVYRALDFVIGDEAKAKLLALNDPDFLKTQMLQGNLSFSLDYRRKLPGNRILWVRNILHLVSEPNTKERLLFEYCYDIHGQKMAEEVLRSAVSYDYESVSCVEFGTGTVMYYGQFGGAPGDAAQSYEEVRAAYARRIPEPEERSRFLADSAPGQVMEQVAARGTYAFTVKTRREDGRDAVDKIRFAAYDAEHQIYIMARTDVTDVLREEEQKNVRLREALTVAQQANGAKSDFLAAMSHDIRTPMNAIVGMCQLALEDEEDREQVHDSLQTIQSSAQLLLALINNILDMSRIESGKMILSREKFSLTREIQETSRSYRGLAERKHQTFRLQISITHDSCIGDAARIHSALDNILTNAIKYTPEGGTVTYRVSEIPSDKPGIGRYRFEIRDTGIGIEKEALEHLFEPFYRGENGRITRVEGTGLGLSITKAIVDLKGGTISVNSTPGQGSLFTVELPIHLAEEQALPEELPQSGPGGYDLSGIRVLLCEDHPVNQKVARRLLEKVGARVTVAADGKDGLEQFENSPPGTFDLILMDVRMPRMDGYAAARAIRSSGQPGANTIPILAMTANAFAEDVQKSMEAGMNAHLAKPIQPRQLYETILRYGPGDRKRK